MNVITRASALPVTYKPAYETVEEGEVETCAQLTETLRSISAITWKDSGHATRSVHAKSHGLLSADLRVLDDLPSVLAQGIFAKPGTWPVVMRFSTVPGDILDDNVSTPRGLAIKVVGVDGDRLEGSEDATTQDFVLVNSPTFPTSGARKFLSRLKVLAATTDKVPALKKALSTVFRSTEKVIESLGAKSGTLRALGGHPETHILGETFFSQAPILFGPYMAKISVAPFSPELKALANAPVDLGGKPNGLRQAVIEFFASHHAEWELRVQLCTDLKTMPIEDASTRWPEGQSPFVAVARIVAKPQIAWSDARSSAIDDGMSFSPWHGIADHRPIGSIMRVRKVAYEMSAEFRAGHNGRAISEPRELDSLRL